MARDACGQSFCGASASAVRWVCRFNSTGEISPAPTRGDQRSLRIEAHSDYLLGLIRRQPEITLLESQRRSPANGGDHFAAAVIQRFVDRLELTFTQRPSAPRSSDARTSCRSARRGLRRTWSSDPRSSFSAPKRARRPIGRAKAALPSRVDGCGPAFVDGDYKIRSTTAAGVRLSGLVAQKAYGEPMSAALCDELLPRPTAAVPTLSKRRASSRHGSLIEPRRRRGRRSSIAETP